MIFLPRCNEIPSFGHPHPPEGHDNEIDLFSGIIARSNGICTRCAFYEKLLTLRKLTTKTGRVWNEKRY